jgi:phospholipid/cholesterol/gamma-HCH transport system substrate-binding protein
MPSAKRVKWAKSRVGLVGVVSASILGVFILLLAGGTWFREQATAYLYVPDATGLAPGSPVRVDGIGVGKVASVSISGSREPHRVVKVTLRIERQMLRSIPADSTAQIGAETMVGDRFVDISSGTAARRLALNGEIPYQADAELMKSLDLGQFEKSMRQVEGLLDDIENGRGRVGQFVQSETVYSDMRKRVVEAERGLREAVDQTTAVGQALFTDRLYRDVEKSVLELDRGLARLQAGQGGAGQFLRDPARYEELLNSARETRRSVEELRASELMRSEEMYASWTRAVAGIIRNVDQVNAGPIMTSSAFFDNLNGAAREMAETARDFRLNPKKYLRMKLF